MKKYILAVFLTLTLSINAFALIPLSVEDQIIRLRAEIARLTAEIARLQSEQGGRFCYQFNTNLSSGDNHPDWTKMGQVLQMEGVTTVKELQEKYEADTLRPAGLRLGTGYVGPLTRAKLNTLYRCQPPISNNLPPTISGVTGPTVLKVGEQGNWTINASDPENGPLNYSVHWGDEPLTSVPLAGDSVSERAYNQTATLTHTYSRAGTYYPKFWVRDNAGNTQWTSLSVVVGANTRAARVTVTSPNGGEVWESYSIQPIKWKVNDRNIKKVDLYLQHEVLPCPPGLACAAVVPSPIVLDKNISASLTYNWIVGTDISNNVIPAGRFWLSVCPAGSDNSYDEGCDESSNTFTIRNISILEMTTSGGYCAGPCNNPKFFVQANGDWMYLLGATTVKQGRLTSAVMSDLTNKISSANFTEIKSVRSTYCPSAADGLDVVYNFKLNSINQRVSNCEYVIPSEHPLFVLISEILSDIEN